MRGCVLLSSVQDKYIAFLLAMLPTEGCLRKLLIGLRSGFRRLRGFMFLITKQNLNHLIAAKRRERSVIKAVFALSATKFQLVSRWIYGLPNAMA